MIITPKAKVFGPSPRTSETKTTYKSLSKGPAFQLSRAAAGEDEDCVKVTRVVGPDGRVYVTRSWSVRNRPGVLSPERKAIVEVDEACEARICAVPRIFFVSWRVEKHGNESVVGEPKSLSRLRTASEDFARARIVAPNLPS
jgi:hypothetical protein